MRICIPSVDSGEKDALLGESLEGSEVLRYYDQRKDGEYELVALTRMCVGGCIDPVEAIIRRRVSAVIVVRIAPGSLMRFRDAGVRVFKSVRTSVQKALDAFQHNGLEDADSDRQGGTGRNRTKDV